MWPLCFWLPTTYAAASPPVASIFSIMTKVGVYIMLRLSLLLFGEGSGASAGFGSDWLLWGGMATIAFGAIGTLASQDTARLGGFSVLVSSGTVLAATGTGQASVTGGALFYLVSSTLGISAFFLLAELIERGREPGADVIAVTREAYGEDDGADDTEEEVGIAIVATMGLLGVAFIGCALVIAGLPPLSGFIAKFALLTAALQPSDMHPGGAVPGSGWALLLALLVSSFATLVAMTRAGIRSFWASPDRTVPRVRVIEMAPIMFLLIICAAQTVLAGPVMRFMQATAQSLHAPAGYVNDVLEIGSKAAERWVANDAIAALSAGELLSSRIVAAAQSSSHGRTCPPRLRDRARRRADLTVLEPPSTRVRRPGVLLRLLGLVAIDIIRSNLAVGRIILGFGRRQRKSGFVNIPLDMRNPYGLAMLACIITSTPGTLWVNFDAQKGLLMIHVLDLVDEAEWIRSIKHRYERHLLEIFE